MYKRQIYGDVTSPYEVYLPPNTLINYIFHTANVTSSKNMITYPVHTILTAIEGTNQILRMAVNKNIQGMVYTSSMEDVYKRQVVVLIRKLVH